MQAYFVCVAVKSLLSFSCVRLQLSRLLVFMMSPLTQFHYKLFVLDLLTSEATALDVLQSIAHVKLTVSYETFHLPLSSLFIALHLPMSSLFIALHLSISFLFINLILSMVHNMQTKRTDHQTSCYLVPARVGSQTVQ